METFLNTYLPWGIVIATVVICFYINIIDTNRQRESKRSENASFMTNKKLEAAVIAGMFVGATLCYLGLPLPLLWGIAIGSAAGLALGLLRRKQGK